MRDDVTRNVLDSRSTNSVRLLGVDYLHQAYYLDWIIVSNPAWMTLRESRECNIICMRHYLISVLPNAVYPHYDIRVTYEQRFLT